MLTWEDVTFLERMADAHHMAGLHSNAAAFQDLANRITKLLAEKRKAVDSTR